ncbi:hypothetical protein DFP72DRAFT_782591, partial [Ephemerocybe angulata]
AKSIIKFRRYLQVPNYKHRTALTKILLSNHLLALERLRWRDPRPPRESRLCRLCEKAVESPEHALLECKRLGPTVLRRKFLRQVTEVDQSAIETLGRLSSEGTVAQLRWLANNGALVDLLAEHAYEVLEHFDKYPM